MCGKSIQNDLLKYVCPPGKLSALRAHASCCCSHWACELARKGPHTPSLLTSRGPSDHLADQPLRNAAVKEGFRVFVDWSTGNKSCWVCFENYSPVGPPNVLPILSFSFSWILSFFFLFRLYSLSVLNFYTSLTWWGTLDPSVIKTLFLLLTSSFSLFALWSVLGKGLLT